MGELLHSSVCVIYMCTLHYMYVVLLTLYGDMMCITIAACNTVVMILL